jgi:hypothetical protein
VIRMRTCHALVIILFCAVALLSQETRPPKVNVAKPNDAALEELHNIGIKISQAVLARDIETLLTYDRPDLRVADREVLKDKTSVLYCTLFDTSCITWRHRSVYEIFRTAPQLDIKAQGLGSGTDGLPYALLLFYDRSKVSERMLRSPQFLCAQWGKRVVLWTFKRVDGRWESATPPFDAETGGPCPED